MDDQTAADLPIKMDVNLPLSYVVPIPNPSARMFGRRSTSGPLGCFIMYRANVMERERLATAAAHVGIPYSAFMRYVVNHMVDQILAAHGHAPADLSE